MMILNSIVIVNDRNEFDSLLLMYNEVLPHLSVGKVSDKAKEVALKRISADNLHYLKSLIICSGYDDDCYHTIDFANLTVDVYDDFAALVGSSAMAYI